MATAAQGKAAVGTIKVSVGDVKVIGVDGVARNALVGERVFAKEIIQTSANGLVQIQLENGRFIDLGRDSRLALDENVTAGGSPATAGAPAGQDIAAIQAQIAAGADPSKVAEATAAGGAAPGAGGADGGGGTPLLIEQANSIGEVTSGFNTGPASIAFPEIQPELLPVIEGEPVINVSVAVNVDIGIGIGGEPGGGGLTVLPPGTVVPALGVTAINIVEGTGGAPRPVSFLITLSAPSETDVTITYTIVPVSAASPEDFFNGPMTGTVTIPAGSPGFIVTELIVEDADPEGNESFQIVLSNPIGATLLNDTATVTIVDDDVTLAAANVAGDESGGLVTLSGALIPDYGPGDTGAITLSASGATWSAATNTLSANNGSWTIVVNSNGTYTFNQLAAFTHPDTNNADEPLSFTVSAVAQDSVGNSASTSFTVTVDDAGPVANDDGQLASVDDNAAGVNIGTVAQLLGNDNYDTDGAAASGSIVIATGDKGGTISIVNGNLIYTSAFNVSEETAIETFTYTIKDADGDTDTATFTVELTDGGPFIGGQDPIEVDEEGLEGGNQDPGQVASGDLPGSAVTKSGNFAGLDFGQDGPGDITLAASSDTGLRTLSGNVVRTEWDQSTHTLTGLADTGEGDEVVFTLVIDNVATGHYVFTLLLPVQHALQGADVVEDDRSFSVAITVTDSEGDPAFGSISIVIDDDSPIAVLQASGEDSATLDDSDFTSVTLFSNDGQPTLVDASQYGADGFGSRSFSLTLSEEGVDSGLDHISGVNILLFTEGGGDIVGRAGSNAGVEVFRFSVNPSTGEVEVSQSAAIKHDDPSDHQESNVAEGTIAQKITAGLITLTMSITDADNDADSDGIEVGSLVTFLDDGPTAPTVNLSQVEPVVLTFDGGLSGNFTGNDLAADTNASKTVAVVDFSTAFTIGNQGDYGADGAGSTTISYVLQFHEGFTEGSASGLRTSAGDQPIYLWEIGGVIIGSTSNSEGGAEAGKVFTLSVDAITGVVTLTQFQAIDHTTTSTYNGAYIDDTTAVLGNLKIDLKASGYTTDSEGDKSATASALLDLGNNVKFGDDGPKVTLAAVSNAQLVLDESVGTTGSVLHEGGRQNNDETLSVDPDDIGYATISAASLFTIDVQAGADGENAVARSFSLSLAGNAASVTTTLQDSVTNANVVLSIDLATGDVLGKAGASGPLVFRIHVDAATGDVTVSQYRAIEHDDPLNHDENGVSAAVMAAGLVFLNVQVQDNEGDKANSNSLELGSLIKFEDDGPSITAPNAVMANDLGIVLTAPVNVDYGSDGGVLSLTGYSAGVGGVIQGTFVNAQGQTVTTDLTYDNQTLTYNQISSTQWVAENTAGVDVFTITLNSATKTYTVTMHQELDPILNKAQFRTADVINAGIEPVVVFEDDPSGIAMRVTTDTLTTGGNEDKVNTTGTWIGSGNQSIGPDDAVLLEFADVGSWFSNPLLPNFGDQTGSYSPVSVNKISFNTRALGSTEKLQWTAYDGNGNVISGATWTVVRFDDVTNGEATPGTSGVPVTVSAVNNVVTLNGNTYNGWEINGSGAANGNNEDVYVLQSSVTFSKIVFEGGASSTFDLGYIDIEVIKGTFDITTNFEITATDGDMDTAKDTVSLTFSNDATLTGTSEGDVIQGGTGSDILTGGIGSDILTGGGGADTFVWKSGNTGNDTVTDFDGGQGDVLNVAELISDGLTMTAVASNGHLQLQFTSGATVVQTIDVNTLAVANNTEAANLLTQLLSTNKIID